MIARPKMSQNEWKTTEIRASKVGNFSPFSCPGTDPDAVWHYQGWILGLGDLDVVKGYVAAVPRGRLVISDMWSEWAPLQEMLDAADVPFLHGALQNFGGTLFLGVSVSALAGANTNASSPPGVAASLEAGGASAFGVGAFPEGIDQNLPYWVYFFDANWNATTPGSVDGWWGAWADARYAAPGNEAARRAWALVGASAYGVDDRDPPSGGFYHEKAQGGLLSAPLLHDPSDAPVAEWYDPRAVVEAWRLLAHADLAASAPLDYDLANLGREALGRVADGRFPALATATTAEGARGAAAALLEVYADADALLCASPSLRARDYFDLAAALAEADGSDASFYDTVARAQVTTWYPACVGGDDVARGVCSRHADADKAPALEDYANKAWGGMVLHYYGGRVGCYASTFGNASRYLACVDDLAVRFQADHADETFPLCAAAPASAEDLSKALLAKYFPA